MGVAVSVGMRIQRVGVIVFFHSGQLRSRQGPSTGNGTCKPLWELGRREQTRCPAAVDSGRSTRLAFHVEDVIELVPSCAQIRAARNVVKRGYQQPSTTDTEEIKRTWPIADTSRNFCLKTSTTDAHECSSR